MRSIIAYTKHLSNNPCYVNIIPGEKYVVSQMAFVEI